MRLAVVLLAVGLIAGFYLSGLSQRYSWAWLRANLTDLQDTADANITAAILVFFLVYVLVTSLSLPVAVWLTLLGGALFGRWVGTAVVSVAAMIGATVAMLGSRYVFREWVRQRFGRRLDAINRGVERGGAYYLFTLRLIPAVPFWLLNLGMGLTPIRTRTYALVSWVGMLPATFVYVNAGTELSQIESPADVLTARVLGALLLLACLPLGVRFLAHWPARRSASR
ncbi:MAG TPA: TVP38/TMEM64 family protein [Fimbriiglobus sp.]|nr:TVP38/TMEM64 family protein [Fimbriiglobus sp.]